MNLRIGLIIVAFLFAGIYLPAQNPCIRHYTTADGLPSNTVYYVFQDSKRFIWFATDAGVARYDGSHFDYYKKRDGLSSNEVVRIQEDSFGRIWFFNLNGTINFIWHNTIFNEFNAPFLDSLKSKEFFRRFFQDEDKILYFYYNHQRDIIALDSQNNITKNKIPSVIHYDIISRDSIDCMVIRNISKAETGDFILWTQAGIFKLKNFNESPALVSKELLITNVFPGNNQINYVVGTWSGRAPYVIVEFDNKRLTDTILLPLKGGKQKKLFSFILEDRGGLLWVSMFKEGLYCLEDKRVINHFNIKEGQALMQDHEDNIWISSMCDGVYKINPFLGFIQHYNQTVSGLSGINAIDENPAGGVWCTDGNRVSLFQCGSFFRLEFLNDGSLLNRIKFLKNNILMIWQKGSRCFEFKGINVDSSIMKVHYRKIIRSLNNRKEIALNSFGNEIATYDHFYLFVSSPDQLNNDSSGWINIKERIYNIFYNRDDELVVNASKNYTLINDTLEPIAEFSFLNNRIITDHLILNDSIELINIEGDSLYLYTTGGMCNLTAALETPLDFQIKHIAYDDPRLYLASTRNLYVFNNPPDILERKPVRLNSLDFSFRNVQDILVKNGTLYIASDDGLTVIPDSVLRDINTHLPIPYFQSILINDQVTDPEEDQVTLKGHNRINLIFSSKSYSDCPVTYSYMLEGADHDWTNGSGTNVLYQNLLRGEYVFKVRARKPTSEWSAPIEYRFTIKATFWQHPLFFIGLSLLFAMLVALVIIRRKNLQLKRREIDHQLITLEQKALQSMMNPHFVFNALSSIQSYLLMNKTREAGVYLTQFARLIRQNLSAINSPMISLDEEIDRLRNYLDLEQLRMSDGFDYTIELDESVVDEEVTIPSMIIQPFAENAIVHGISPLDQKGTIRILLSMHSEKALMIIIEDNGVGLQRSGTASGRSEKHLNMGMNMTYKRLEILGKKMNVETSVKFSEAFPGSPNPGTRVVMIVPVGE